MTSWFARYFSSHILWSEDLHPNKVVFETQQATVRIAKRLYIFRLGRPKSLPVLNLVYNSMFEIFIFTVFVAANKPRLSGLWYVWARCVCACTRVCPHCITGYSLCVTFVCLHTVMFTVRQTACAHTECHVDEMSAKWLLTSCLFMCSANGS